MNFVVLSLNLIFVNLSVMIRLYNLQRKSLMILAKLFVGRSCNPQPGRTTPYTTQQLYVGTISFAILLFLLPTTLIYYIVFVVVRKIQWHS